MKSNRLLQVLGWVTLTLSLNASIVSGPEDSTYGSVSDTKYIFEIGKLPDPLQINGDAVNADQFLRYYFLEMYKQNPTYFWNGTSSWWQSIDNSITSQQTLTTFLNNSGYNSSWLNFVKAK